MPDGLRDVLIGALVPLGLANLGVLIWWAGNINSTVAAIKDRVTRIEDHVFERERA